jgi:hypothetical protein
MNAAKASGREITVREMHGRKLWLVPHDLVTAVGCMAAVVW